ncbi:hypothetical protein GCM10009539_54560 [Cryptosporangium japonicum]|uniref:Uncharacterized protein n=1 Tax=Cryptosporangium japonicum TaxID=80872 RepID=A0ABN0UUL8_9ACTN
MGPVGEPVRAEASAWSVQTVLLALGGALLAVAAIVFTVVAWGTFGIGGRAVILAGITAVTFAVPALLHRRGLASTAETIGLLGLVLLALDGYALHHVGLVPPGGPRYTGLVLGTVAAVALVYPVLVPLRTLRPAGLVLAHPAAVLLVSPSLDVVAAYAALGLALVGTDVAVRRHAHAPVLRGAATGAGAVTAFLTVLSALIAAAAPTGATAAPVQRLVGTLVLVGLAAAALLAAETVGAHPAAHRPTAPTSNAPTAAHGPTAEPVAARTAARGPAAGTGGGPAVTHGAAGGAVGARAVARGLAAGVAVPLVVIGPVIQWLRFGPDGWGSTGVALALTAAAAVTLALRTPWRTGTGIASAVLAAVAGLSPVAAVGFTLLAPLVSPELVWGATSVTQPVWAVPDTRPSPDLVTALLALTVTTALLLLALDRSGTSRGGGITRSAATGAAPLGVGAVVVLTPAAFGASIWATLLVVGLAAVAATIAGLVRREPVLSWLGGALAAHAVVVSLASRDATLVTLGLVAALYAIVAVRADGTRQVIATGLALGTLSGWSAAVATAIAAGTVTAGTITAGTATAGADPAGAAGWAGWAGGPGPAGVAVGLSALVALTTARLTRDRRPSSATVAAIVAGVGAYTGATLASAVPGPGGLLELVDRSVLAILALTAAALAATAVHAALPRRADIAGSQPVTPTAPGEEASIAPAGTAPTPSGTAPTPSGTAPTPSGTAPTPSGTAPTPSGTASTTPCGTAFTTPGGTAFTTPGGTAFTTPGGTAFTAPGGTASTAPRGSAPTAGGGRPSAAGGGLGVGPAGRSGSVAAAAPGIAVAALALAPTVLAVVVGPLSWVTAVWRGAPADAARLGPALTYPGTVLDSIVLLIAAVVLIGLRWRVDRRTARWFVAPALAPALATLAPALHAPWPIALTILLALAAIGTVTACVPLRFPTPRSATRTPTHANEAAAIPTTPHTASPHTTLPATAIPTTVTPHTTNTNVTTPTPMTPTPAAPTPAAPTNPGTAIPGTAIPGTAIPGTAIPGTALPGTTIPGTATSNTSDPAIPNTSSPASPAGTASTASTASIASTASTNPLGTGAPGTATPSTATLFGDSSTARVPRGLAAGLTALTGLDGLAWALADRTATLVVLSLVLAAAATVTALARDTAPRTVGAATAAAAAIALAFAAGAAAAVPVAYLLVGVATVLVLPGVFAAPRVPGDVLDVGAAVAGVLALGLSAVRTASAMADPATGGTVFTPATGGTATFALTATLLGVPLGLAGLRASRRWCSRLVPVVELVALWAWLGRAGVSVPEAYTQPAAALAAAFGLYTLRRRPAVSSWLALGPALAVATVPTLAVALTAGTLGLRVLALGLAALVVTLAGAATRRQAPFLVGATVLGLVTARALAPVLPALADTVPTWVPLSLAGALLLAVGATYERRRRDATRLAGFIRAMH